MRYPESISGPAMRIAFLSALAVALLLPMAGAQDTAIHETPRFTVTLPATFKADVHVVPAGGNELRSDYFFDSESQRLVTITTYTGLSWWQRFRFHRGWGASKQTPHTYHRVAPETLGLSPSLTTLAGSAFFLDRPDSDGVGIQIRGCDGDVCYSIGVGDPQAGSDVTPGDLASLI